ncbi:MBOAT family O-acyltransferase [Maribacter halichondriae]|uniref:MBOAT family O-acyltransferase n=1 Tax=Maribacter halichondriae TaxID=2980554 RepID=UPI0023591EF5|nr:MBOAT family O-acyltransferase [Maribacter sp. Hal144]
MLFNSIDFAIFLPIVFVLYWFSAKKDMRYQNILIVLASYFFYGMWDYRFLALIIFSTLVDYTLGRQMAKTDVQSTRKILLWTSIIVNLGFLGFFKYYNFFLDNFVDLFTFFGQPISTRSLNIVLPVGISFYTFQTLSYTIDVYRKNLDPTKDFIAFAAFVSFFPQLVAGPIERATNLLPQFRLERVFEYNKAVDGLRQMLWGLFKKMVIADNAAKFANIIFDNSEAYSGSTLLLGGVFFAFQIYGDFSGYSDIAIGTSRLFGFDLMKNFAFPYFSRDISEFWRRWHISLSTWFRDYLYIPLGGSRGGIWMKVRNTFIIFLVSGFWHGANWTFVVWGALNAIYFLPLLLLNRNRNNLGTVAEGKYWPSFNEFLKILSTFALTVLAWIFFRADSVSHAFGIMSEIFSLSLFKLPSFEDFNKGLFTLFLVAIFILIEWRGRNNEYAIEKLLLYRNKRLRWTFYMLLAMMILVFQGEQQEFIYFQF